MPTPSEQKALAFVAIVVLLGGAVRVLRAGAPLAPTPLEQQALARQATAAESAAAEAGKKRSTRARAPRRAAEPKVVGGVAGVSAWGAPPAAPQGRNGFPPPLPRIDVDYRDNRRSGSSTVSEGPPPGAGGSERPPVDLDRADAHEIEALPRVGPATARRIVANRDSFGAFGSLEALGRVRGMGPATRKRLAPLVTFSGRPSSRP